MLLKYLIFTYNSECQRGKHDPKSKKIKSFYFGSEFSLVIGVY